MSMASGLTGRFSKRKPMRLIALAVGLLGANPSGVYAAPEGSGAAAVGGVYYQAKARALGEVLREITARSGIRFRLADGLGRDKISMSLRGSTWTEATQRLLQGYNYAVEAGPGGVWETVTVSGKNGDGRDAVSYPRKPAKVFAAKPQDLPVRYQGFKPGSVMPINLPLAALKGMKKGQKISLDLPGGPHSLVHDNRFNHANGDITWVGHAEQDGQSYRTMITIGQSGPMGEISASDGQYQIVTEGGQSYLIDINAAGLEAGSLREDQMANPGPEGGNVETEAAQAGGGGFGGAAVAALAAANPGQAGGAGAASAADSTAPVSIDLLVFYAKGLAQPATRVNYLTALTNQAFLDSKINAKIRVVHAQAVDYTETNDNSQALAGLTDGKAPFAEVAALRDRYGADLVTLIRPFHANTQKGCGVAWVNGSNGGELRPDLAYSVVSDGDDRDGALLYCGGQTLAHELGHNLGNVHDRPFSDVAGAFPYSYAWGVEGVFGTIMSYRQPAVPLFASPLLTDACHGQPCGYAEGTAEASDNARTINQTAPVVAGFRPATVEDKSK